MAEGFILEIPEQVGLATSTRRKAQAARVRAIYDQRRAEGFEFVAMGRALLREPDLVNRMRDGQAKESACIHCNKCMPTIYRGTHCVLVDPEDRPGYRLLPVTR